MWIAEDIETILAGIKDGSWIDTTLGAVSAGLDALAFISDPIGSLLQYGVAWIIEHVKPLSEALDWLAGDPGQISAHAQTWRNVASTLHDRSSDLDRAVRWDTTEWQGAAADAYRTWTGQQKDAVAALAGAAETMAAVTEGAGMLVAGVRMMVRDAIAVLVSRLITYAAEEVFSFGLATPLVVEQVSTLCASWGARIAKWLRGLVSSLEHLRGLTGKLGDAIEAIKKLLTRLRHGDASTLDRVKKRGAGPTQLFNHESARNIAAKYGIDISDLNISLGSKTTRGICGRTLPNGSIVLFPTGFRSEEDLARTLVHERFHHDELASGKPFPTTAEEFDAFEDRAYAHEEQWWNSQPIRPEPRTR
ncbi:WXG100 family type VII secretion target [Actinoplanes sp. NPDC051343]|uniref:WXG100 family type VII secretion target n=1 Tax=Actinoplanes sp. NPDC051343 TaxID=3363906 RepID=UPI003797D80B